MPTIDDLSPKREFKLRIDSYGSFPVTRPSHLPLSPDNEESKGCLSILYARLMGHRRRSSSEDENEASQWQPEAPATWKEYLVWWLRVDQWKHEVGDDLLLNIVEYWWNRNGHALLICNLLLWTQELIVAGFILALLFFSAAERIFFKAAVDDMAPFRSA